MAVATALGTMPWKGVRLGHGRDLDVPHLVERFQEQNV
jgi:hypothetical protein